MRRAIVLGMFLWALGMLFPRMASAQTRAEDFIELEITAAFSPEELSALIQKLGKRGIILRFEETGYCNGELRILKGEIIGSDGSRFGFETRALRKLNIRLVAHTKALGVEAIKLKNRWRKCKEADQDEQEDEADDLFSQPVQQI